MLYETVNVVFLGGVADAVRPHALVAHQVALTALARPRDWIPESEKASWWDSVRWAQTQDAERRPDVPDRLVGEPAGVALVQAVLEGGQQLCGCGHGGVDGAARLRGLVEVKRVTAAVGSVVENHAWGESRRSAAGDGKPEMIGILDVFRQMQKKKKN